MRRGPAPASVETLLTRREGKPFAPFVRKDSRTTIMLPAQQRLRKNEDFRVIYRRGRSHVNEVAVLYVLKRTGATAVACPNRRVGFVVSKKQGDAHVRNRIKRRLREAVRLRLPELREGSYDLIVVGRSPAGSVAWPAVQAAVADLLRRGGLLMAAPLPQNGAETEGL